MELSIVILNYNVKHFLEACITSVIASIENIDAEIIVIDNNSSDESCYMIKEKFPTVKLIENTENLGFSRANNIAIERAKGKYICILNPDTIVAEDIFVILLAFAKEQHNLGAIGCKLIDGKGNFLPESKRNTPTLTTSLSKIFPLNLIFKNSNRFENYYNNKLNKNQTGETDILVGAFMFMERETFNLVNGFDEKFFMYGEDIDLSYRILKLGKKNFYYGNSTIIHFKGESTNKDKTYIKHFKKAMILFYKKHYAPSNAFLLVFNAVSYLFSIIKTYSPLIEIRKNPKQYLLISSSLELANKLSHSLGKQVICVEKEETKNIKCRTEIILDNNSISFKRCIQIMENCKNKKTTFKILPKDCKYIIGSNNSNVHGEIIEI